MKQISIDEKEALSSLLSTDLFSGTDPSLLRTALQNGDFQAVNYDAGEIICSPVQEERKMVFFISGLAEVYSADETRSVLLRTVKCGGVIGVANLFSDEKYVSRVIALKNCKTLEISSEKFGILLEKDRSTLYNYIGFLSKRIRYLNRKIVCLTAGSAERRLAYFLDTAAFDQDCDKANTAEITVQMNTLCEMLNLGRASLYRAADKLCEEGFISREGKKILILDRHGMMQKFS